MTKVDFFVVFILILIFLGCVYVGFSIGIDNPKDLPTLEKIEIVMLNEYDDMLDLIGYNYQKNSDSHYLGWAINDDNGLHFKFRNKNGNIYCASKETVVNYIKEISEKE